MIKIIKIDSSSGLGGGQRIVFEIIKALRPEFDFLIIAPPGLFLKKYSQLEIEIHRLEEKKIIKIIKTLSKLIKKKSPEILHFHGTRAAIWGRLAVIGLRNKPKIIYTLHGFHIIRRNFFIKWPLVFLEKFLNRWTDILVCVSESDRKLVLKYKTISPKKIKVIKNGIDTERFRVDQEKIWRTKKELDLENNFVLCSIGRLHPPKDFSTILKALKLVISEIKNVKLLIVGDGPLRQSLEREMGDLILNRYVKFLGFREDIPVLIGLSDAVILSTNWEGLPLLPIETGACKKPIIASNVEGVREMIIDGKNGFLFQVGSAEDLAKKILKLYKSEKLRKEIGENGYKFVLENFNRERMVQDYKNLYQSLFNENSSG